MKTIYIIERHTGESYNYTIHPIIAFEDKEKAEKWNKIYNKDVQILLKELNLLMLKREKIYEISNLNIISKSKNTNHEELKKLDTEEKNLYKSYKYEHIDYIFKPTNYKILEIDLVTDK